MCLQVAIHRFHRNFSDPNTTAARECPVCRSTRCRRIVSFDDFQFYTDSAELPKIVSLSDKLVSRLLHRPQESLLHRVGATGCAGRSGVFLQSLCGPE